MSQDNHTHSWKYADVVKSGREERDPFEDKDEPEVEVHIGPIIPELIDKNWQEPYEPTELLDLRHFLLTLDPKSGRLQNRTDLLDLSNVTLPQSPKAPVPSYEMNSHRPDLLDVGNLTLSPSSSSSVQTCEPKQRSRVFLNANLISSQKSTASSKWFQKSTNLLNGTWTSSQRPPTTSVRPKQKVKNSPDFGNPTFSKNPTTSAQSYRETYQKTTNLSDFISSKKPAKEKRKPMECFEQRRNRYLSCNAPNLQADTMDIMNKYIKILKRPQSDEKQVP